MDKVFIYCPRSRTQVYDMKRVIRAVVDKDTLFELKPRFGRSAGDGARPAGRKERRHRLQTIRCIAAARWTPTPAARSSTFIVLCDSFNMPIVIFVDTPGFQIGTEAERAGAPGKIMNFMNAMTLVTVPHLSVIVRKSYGRAYVCMGGGRHSDDIAAWPTAEISFMSPEFATKIVHGVGVGEPGLSRRRFANIEQGSDVWGLASVLRGAGRDSTRAYARLPHPHARCLQAAHDERRRAAPDANWPTSY